MRTGGEAVVDALLALGVRHVFGIASVHNLAIVDALGREPEVRFVPVRHEQAAVHAADGAARATGRLGVALASTGPGTANAMGGLFEAAYASSPVLLLTGQVDTSHLGKGRGFLHEAEHQADMLRAVGRRVETVRRREDVAETVLAVAADILTGRPQPGAVEIPADLQTARSAEPPPAARVVRLSVPDEKLLERAAALLEAAERPLLWAGGGVISAGASGRLTELAERLGAPVLTTIEGRGAIPEDHPLAVGPNADMVPGAELVAEADVVLAVGTRFEENSPMAQGLRIPGRLVHLDVDPGVLNRVHRADVAVAGDGLLALEQLLELVPAGRSGGGGLSERGRIVRAAIEAETRDAMGPDYTRLLDAMRAGTPREAVVVKDVTIAAYLWGNRLLPVYAPRTAMRPTSMGIGPGLPLGIGAAVASGSSTVVLTGDGGFMLSVAELATVVQEQLPLVLCVLNDRGYGILRHVQDIAFGARHVGVDLVTPDFAALARASGMQSVSVTGTDGFELAFARAVAAKEPWLLDVDIRAMTPMQLRPQRPQGPPGG